MKRDNIRSIALKEVTSEQLEEAEKIINSGVDPNWDSSFGEMYIGVTGRHQVFYTLWKYSPKVLTNPMIYLGNLSTNIVEAAKKAKQRAGCQPIYFENYETLKGMQGVQPEVITFGKYRGSTIGEIYAEDPQYIIWLSKNMFPKNQKQMKQYELVKTLTNDYFRALGEKNRTIETKNYLEIGSKFEGIVNLISFKRSNPTVYADMGYVPSMTAFKVKAETDMYRFMFNLSVKELSKALNLEYQTKYNKENNDFIPAPELINQVTATLKNTKSLEISGKVKYNSEIVGKKWNRLSNVKVKHLYSKVI